MARNSSSENVTLVDGSLDWSGGANSILVTTLASDRNPRGLQRNQLAWLDNATVRGGSVAQRPGWEFRKEMPVVGQWMGAFIYHPDQGQPYLIAVIEGHILKIDPYDLTTIVDLSTTYNLVMPVTEMAYFCQAEKYLIIQAGDGSTLPYFWDGGILRQSVGLDPTGTVTPATLPKHTSEIPAATAMKYYMGRVWYVQNRTVSAGDIVGGPSGYPASDPRFDHLRDAVLCVTENPLCLGGDGFTVPSHAGNIRGLAYAGNLNNQVGEGNLYVGTRNEIYQLEVPVTRSDWINATSDNAPKMTVAVSGIGWVNHRSIVSCNSDLFFQTLEPAVRSMSIAIRYYGQWGNMPISINENRVVQFNDRALLKFSSGMQFDNRLIQTALPYSCGAGVAHKAVVPLNFDIVSSLEGQIASSSGAGGSYPAWEGMWEGLNILEVMSGDFGGLERGFIFHWSETEQRIELWEMTKTGRYDKEGNRVVWYFETPAYTWGNELNLKKLVSAEIWYDNLYGEAILKMEWRPDGYPCWLPWHQWTVCTQTDPIPSPQYPEGFTRPSYRQMETLPVPPLDCSSPMGRPSNVGYQMQCRITIKGYLRIRGIFLKAEEVERKLYEGMVCA